MPTPLTPERWRKFWESFRGEPQQLEAIEKLRQHICQADQSLMIEEAEWILDHWRNKPAVAPGPEPPRVPNPLLVPYFSQLDNASGTGQRECFSSSCAMLAAYWGKVKTDDDYNRIRARYGDTTDATAQVQALRSLGLQVSFLTDGSPADLEREIDAGRPVAVGWLHKGSSVAPLGGGHWSVVVGYTADAWIQNDPFGEASLVMGGYTANTNGRGVRYSRRNWNPRWLPGGSGGWFLTAAGGR